MTTTRPARAWAEVTGGDALGRGQQPVLCWWLPEGSSVQHAYRLRTDDGYDTGRVEGTIQSFVRLPVFDRSRRSALAQVKAWTDLGESTWSDPVRLESGLLAEQDWQARWIGVQEAGRPEKGSRPAYWLRTLIDVPPSAGARLYLTALGLYEAFLDGTRVGDAELTPGYTQYRARVQYQAYDIDLISLARPGRHVLAVLLADGWYRGQVGLLRSAGQVGERRRPTSPRPTSSAASERTAGASRPCTTCRSTTERGARLFPATSTSPSSGRSLPRCAEWKRSSRPPCGRCAAGALWWSISGRTSAAGCGWDSCDPQCPRAAR